MKSHQQSDARMVDISGKEATARTAVAQAIVRMDPRTLELVKKGKLAKGDVVSVARTAAIMAAKKTPELIPLCHPIAISSVSVHIEMQGDDRVVIRTTVKATDRTGVEMEALTAASVAALAFYDMCKPVDRGITITDICLLQKSGGKSGEYRRLGK